MSIMFPASTAFPQSRAFPQYNTPTGNPYAPTSPPQGGTGPMGAATVVNTLGMTVPAPGEMTPEELAGNIETGLARLQTVNPGLADQFRSQYTGTPPEDEGGVLGFLGDIKDAVLGGAGKALELLGRTSHIVPAIFDPESWEDDNPLNNVWGALTGEDTTNWNEVFQHMGWEGGGIGGVIRSGLGFVGDVLTDPLTYATFGAGAGASVAQKGALAGKSVATKLPQFGERAVQLGLADNADDAALALERVYGALSKAPDRTEQAAQALYATAGREVDDAARGLVRDMFEASDNIYNSVQARTFSTWLRKGKTMKLASGTEVNPADVRKLLEETVKKGIGKAPKSDEWLAARAAAGAIGGARFAPYIPFTSLRYISPMLPGSNALQPLARTARFMAGKSSGKQMEKLVRAGEATWDDLALLNGATDDAGRTGFSALRASKLPHQRELAEKLTAHGRGSSAFYSASDRMGGLTAHFAPGAKLTRLGLPHYFAAEAARSRKANLENVKRHLLYDVVDKDAASKGLSGQDYVYRMVRDAWGKEWTPDDEALASRYLDYFGGLEDVPPPGEMDDWFWARRDVQEALAQAEGASTVGARGELVGPAAATKQQLERQLADMKAVAGQVTGAKKQALDALASVERRGHQVVNEYGVLVGDTTVANMDAVKELHPDDVGRFNGQAHRDYQDGEWHVEVQNPRLGVSDLDNRGHGDLGVQGVRASRTPSASSQTVAVNPRKVLVVGEGETSTSSVLTDGKVLQDAQARATREMQAVKEAMDAEGIPLSPASPLHPDNWDDTLAELVTKDLKARGGLEYDAILFRKAEGDELVLLGTKEVDPWSQVKAVNKRAPRLRPTRGYFHRTFSKEVNAFLRGAPGQNRAVHAVRDLASKARREAHGKTLEEAEAEARKVLRSELAREGADEKVLAQLDTMPIFERNPMKAHEDYVDNVAESVNGAMSGEFSERMNSLGQLLPERFGRAVAIDNALYQVDSDLIRAVAATIPKAKEAAQNFQSKERKLMNALQRQLEDDSDRLSQVLEAWGRGEEVDLASLAVRNPKLQRLLDAAENKAEVIAQERRRIDAAREANKKAMADAAAVEELIWDQLGWAEDMVVTPLGGGRYRVTAWHATGRGSVPVEGPDPGTTFTYSGAHVGPRNVAEGRMHGRQHFQVIDDETGDVLAEVDEVDADEELTKWKFGVNVHDADGTILNEEPFRNEAEAKAWLAESYSDLRVDAPLGEPGTASIQPSQVSILAGNAGADMVDDQLDTLFPVQFEGRLLEDLNGQPVLVRDAEAHMFGDVAQGKSLALEIAYGANGEKVWVRLINDVDSLKRARAREKGELPDHGMTKEERMRNDMEALAKGAGPARSMENKVGEMGGSYRVLTSEDLQNYDGVMYRNSVEGEAIETEAGRVRPPSMVIFDDAVKSRGVLSSPREAVEKALREGELGIHADGTVTTRSGRLRQAGKGGARKVRPTHEVDAEAADLARRVEDLDNAARQHAPGPRLSPTAERAAQEHVAGRKILAQGASDPAIERLGLEVQEMTEDEWIAALNTSGEGYDPRQIGKAVEAGERNADGTLTEYGERQARRQWNEQRAAGTPTPVRVTGRSGGEAASRGSAAPGGKWQKSAYAKGTNQPERWARQGAPNGNTVELVPLSVLERMPGNTLGKTDVDELAADIQKNGLDEELIVTYDPKTGKAVTGEGNHRVQALKKLGYTHAPVRVTRGAVETAERGVKVNALIQPVDGYVPADMGPSWIGLETMDPAQDALPKRVKAALEREERALGVAGRDAEQQSTARAKEAAANARRVERVQGEVTIALHELNEAMAATEGLQAPLKPAIVMGKASPAGGRAGMRQVNIPGMDDVWVHKYIAEEMDRVFGNRPVGELRNAWREFVLTPWKKFATYRSPGFHVRNAFGAWFNNHLGGVTRADYDFSHRVMMARAGKNNWDSKPLGRAEFERLGFHKNANLEGLEDTLTYGQVSTMLADQGIGRANATTIALIEQTAKPGTALKVASGRAVKGLRQTDALLRKAGAGTEDLFRTAAWAAGMRYSGDAYGARAFVMMRHGDYGDLTDTEDFIKDLVPFYKWMRTNVPYQLRMLAEEPGKLLMVQKAQQSIYDAAGVSDEYQSSQPDWMKRGLNIPIPFLKDGADQPMQISFDLPYGDLYKGTREYLSSILPVVSDVVESTVLKQDTFTGMQLTGEMKPVGGMWNLPGLKQLMAALPGSMTGKDGQVYIPDTFENVLSAVPVYGRFRPWVSGDPNRVEKRWGAITSFMVGVPVRNVDLTADEKAFYYDVVEPTLDMYRSAGYVFPTKEQLQAAGRLALQPALGADTLFPTGTVGQLPTAAPTAA